MQHSEIEVQRSPLMSLLLHPSGSCGDIPVTAAGAAPCCHITAPHSPQHGPPNPLELGVCVAWARGSVCFCGDCVVRWEILPGLPPREGCCGCCCHCTSWINMYFKKGGKKKLLVTPVSRRHPHSPHKLAAARLGVRFEAAVLGISDTNESLLFSKLSRTFLYSLLLVLPAP